MKKLILSLAILLSCHSAHAATVQGDADSNGALDVAKGGTNSATAADARTALGVPATASTLVGDCTVGPCLDGSTDGGNLIKLWAGTGSYWTALQGGAPAANRSWRLPIDAPPSAGETNVMTMDEYGQMGFLDKPSTSGYVLSSTDAGVLSWIANGAGAMVYPGAGLAVSTGSAWTTSLTCSNDADVIEWDTTTSKFVCVTPVTYTAGTSISLAGNQISVTGLAIGTNVQAYDADLTTWAGVTPGTGVATALAVNIGSAGAVALYNGALGTPSSLNLSNAVVNSGTSLPGTCTSGQLFLDTDADTNGQLYSCISANTWKDVDDDGGSGGMATTDIDTSSEIATIVTDETGSSSGTPLLVFNQNPTINGATITDSATLTFDESAADPDDADIQLSATDGVFKIAAANGANNEDITIDLDAAANKAKFNSGSGLTLITTGSIPFTGAIRTVGKSSDYTIGTDDADEAYGAFFVNTGASTRTFTLPSAVAGMSVCVRNGQGVSQVLRLDANTGDYIVKSTGARTSASAEYYGATADAKNQLCVVAYDATDWYVTSEVGTWTEE